MDTTPVCAPYTEDDESYAPMRMPKTAATTPTHASNFKVPSTLAGFRSNASPTKLSPHATPFTPANSQPPQHQPIAYHPRHHNQHHRYQQHQQNNGLYNNDYAHLSHQRFSQLSLQHQPIFPSPLQDRLKMASSSSSASANAFSSSSTGAPSNNYSNYNSRQRQPSYQHCDGYQTQPTPPQQPDSPTEGEGAALNYLRTVINCLNQNPGQFDTIATRFLTIFDGMENNNYVLCIAMEDIFKESIENPNFRYMGARLYNLLHMLNLKQDSLFHTLLKCKLDFHQKELVEYMNASNQPQKVRETALFLAELYMQLRGDDSRIQLIARNIVFALKQLLLKENVENMRCICMTLKLAGYDLTADCPLDMKEIIAKLEAINCQKPGKYPLAANVISLQRNNWGRKLSASTSMCDEDDKLRESERFRISDEPIFYGPDGRELSAEERDFLTAHVAVGGHAGSTDDEDIGDLDAEWTEFDDAMDEEAEQAFKEFCKQNVPK